MKKGYWIGHVTVTDPERYQEYVRLDTPVVERFGGRFLVRGGEAIAPEGEFFTRHVIIEFPSFTDARACYESEAYQEAADIRKEASDSQMVLVEGHEG